MAETKAERALTWARERVAHQDWGNSEGEFYTNVPKFPLKSLTAGP